MIATKVSTISDASLGEPEQDANSALTELDKGLRSGKVGEQCEAIVRFPRLFERYPFPILINSSFLKLADVFRLGNNFLRLWVLRVCQQSEKHLDKILNIDEFLRRIFSVLHSNDPVARALALKTMGAVAGIIPERQNVHHAIRRGLESTDDVEVDAAIYATTKFAAHSNAFAVAIYNKLADMIECENTGAERRDKLVRALRTVHGGAIRAQSVLNLLRSLIERYPSASSVRAAVASVAAIARDTVVHVPDQVDLLVDIAVRDARASVRRAALAGLRCLAAHAALWDAAAVQRLVAAAAERDHDLEYRMLCLRVFQILVRCPAVWAAAGPESLLREHCRAAAASHHAPLAAAAAALYTDILVHCYTERLPAEGSELMLSLETLVISTGVGPGAERRGRPLRRALRCLVQLSTVAPELYAARTARLLGSQLDMEGLCGPRLEAILEALAALAGGTYSPESIEPALPALGRKLNQFAQLGPDDDNAPRAGDPGLPLVLLCTAACAARAAAAAAAADPRAASWHQLLLGAVAEANCWTQYRVARAALRYGHDSLAATILEPIVEVATSEAVKRWVTAMYRAARAQSMLAAEGITYLEIASGEWHTSADMSAACGGCGGCGGCAGIFTGWLRAGAAALSALSSVALAARALCTQPPPAVAHANAQASRCPAERAGACAAAARAAARRLRAAAAAHGDLARGAFHADDSTLRHLRIKQHTLLLLAHFVERITAAGPAPPPPELTFQGKELVACNLEEKLLLSARDKMAAVFARLFADPDTQPGITHRHASALLLAAAALSRGGGWPRGCGGGAAAARVSLALGDPPAPLPSSHHAALRLHGVAPARKKHEERVVKAVQLTVTAVPHPRGSDKSSSPPPAPPLFTAVQTVVPAREFFSAQQLVPAPSAGLYSLHVAAGLVDQRGDVWDAGPRASLLLKVHDDATTKGNQQAARRF